MKRRSVARHQDCEEPRRRGLDTLIVDPLGSTRKPPDAALLLAHARGYEGCMQQTSLYLKLRVKRLAEYLENDGPCSYAVRLGMAGTYERVPSAFDSEQWRLHHDALVRQTAAELRQQGYTVYREGQNAFAVPVRQCAGTQLPIPVLLTGQPDLVAIGNDEVVVVDCKTGKPMTMHQGQVLLYQLLLPRATRLPYFARLHDLPTFGKVAYKNSVNVDIPAEAVNAEFRSLVGRAIRDLATIEDLDPEPSARACRFCDVASCPVRMTDNPFAPSDEIELT
jgi:hypothetical protein